MGLKPSYFSEEISQESDAEDNDNVSEAGDFAMQVDSEHEHDSDAEDKELGDENDENISEGDDGESNDEEAMIIDPSAIENQDNDDVEEETTPKKKDTPLQPVLSLKGFQWSNVDQANEEDEDQISEDSESDNDESSGKKRKKKKAIEQDLTAEMHTRQPESIADFERHLLASPSSSYLWIQYMSFQLQLSEIDKAREVAKRALQAISIREEQERLNVWIALLNLENTFGTDESLDAAFKDAARHMDSKTVHLRLANIFDQSEKHEVSHTLKGECIFVKILTTITESRRTLQAYQ